MSAQQSNQNIFVAVPYYGTLTLPPLGLSRVFFIATVDIATRKVTNNELQVWDPKNEPNLSVWMRELGVSGVVCSDNGSSYQAAFNFENIWVLWKQEGEATELVERWAAGEFNSLEEYRCGESIIIPWCTEQYGMAVEFGFSATG